MSLLQQITLGLVMGSTVLGGFVSLFLFLFSCIGANAGLSELLISIGYGLVPIVISIFLFGLATLLNVIFSRR